MDWSTILSLLSTVALIGAVVFAGLQVRQTNQLRREQTAIELARSMQSVEWTSAVGPISRIPLHGSATLDPSTEAAATSLALRLETLGYLVFRHAVSLEVIDELPKTMSGKIRKVDLRDTLAHDGDSDG